ncbi:F-box protein SKIP23 [Hordeum vulgare]|nr:F-box protein SKIP23 [Hordeum vulgare]
MEFPRQPARPQPIEAQASALSERSEELLMRVFATLEIPDLARVDSVCTSWRSAYAALCSLSKHKQAQTPCLAYTSVSAGEHVACLYSLVEKRVYMLTLVTLPGLPLRHRFIIGSSLGFLVIVNDRSEMHLVNPITGQQTPLPSVTTIEFVKPIFDESGSVHEYEYPSHSTRQAFYTPSIMACCHGAGAAGMRRPNKEILEHDRRWQTELRMVKLRDTLEEQGCSKADIEQGVKQARKEAAGSDAGGGTLRPGEGYLQDCKEGEVYAVESSEAVRKKREPHLLGSRRSRTTKMAAALAWRFSGTNSGADLVGFQHLNLSLGEFEAVGKPTLSYPEDSRYRIEVHVPGRTFESRTEPVDFKFIAPNWILGRDMVVHCALGRIKEVYRGCPISPDLFTVSRRGEDGEIISSKTKDTLLSYAQTLEKHSGTLEHRVIKDARKIKQLSLRELELEEAAREAHYEHELEVKDFLERIEKLKARVAYLEEELDMGENLHPEGDVAPLISNEEDYEASSTEGPTTMLF